MQAYRLPLILTATVAPGLQQAAANRFDDIVLPKNQDGSENETKEILR